VLKRKVQGVFGSFRGFLGVFRGVRDVPPKKA